MRLPKRNPPQDFSRPDDDSASDQRVLAYSLSSFCLARSIIALNPMGFSPNKVNADGSLTTVGLRILSISLRPTRA